MSFQAICWIFVSAFNLRKIDNFNCSRATGFVGIFSALCELKSQKNQLKRMDNLDIIQLFTILSRSDSYFQDVHNWRDLPTEFFSCLLFHRVLFLFMSSSN